MSDIIRKLQQRIDRRSKTISWLEFQIKMPDNYWYANHMDQVVIEREEQTLDKRLMGELIKLRKELYFYEECVIATERRIIK